MTQLFGSVIVILGVVSAVLGIVSACRQSPWRGRAVFLCSGSWDCSRGRQWMPGGSREAAINLNIQQSPGIGAPWDAESATAPAQLASEKRAGSASHRAGPADAQFYEH